MLAFNNGTYQNLSEINIPITSLSINRGYGAYEFFEVINGKAFYGKEHIDRLIETLKLLRLEIDFSDQLLTIVDELIVRNSLQHAAIKLFALPHNQQGKAPHHAHLYILPCEGLKYNKHLFDKGAKLVTRHFQRFIPRAKSTDYLAGQFWNDELTDPDIIDVLFHNGVTVQETSRGNIFAVVKGKIITPEKEILLGITRQIILSILKNTNFPFEKAELPLNELMNADEVYVTSSTKRVMPIVEIDGKCIGNGKPGHITKELQHKLKDLIDRY